MEAWASVPVWRPAWPHPFGGFVLHLHLYTCKHVRIAVSSTCQIKRLSVAVSDPITSRPDRDLRRLACVFSCQIPWPPWNQTRKVSLHRQDVFPSWSRVEWKVIDAVLLPVWVAGNYDGGGPGWRVHTLVSHILPHLLSEPLLTVLPSPSEFPQILPHKISP